MGRRQKPQLITTAERSPEQELRSRERRYVAMMLLRGLCVILAAILVTAEVPLLWLWLSLLLAGAVFLPWAAVLLANDKGPRPEHRFRNKLQARRQQQSHPDPAHALTDHEQTEPKIIDG
jgi:Flp pilus assembly protein TadB